ncbi:helix-turn-helix domain-containing protein [Anaerococcus sp. mt242]|uniref:helix-turn-helix domain-containing protein n=1 Tax=Anaerococcus sp. mt242 TaxID=2661917 RepID=UPI001931C673|nr:helix-turn-helix transcriptional regulator [Anaerococcus sp. mt242]MBM0045616.1 helix-turn-helix transcriptional regulator [Anaerococcus sp. mt242]
MILADKIISLRKKEGMTQEDLAIQIGVSRQSVSKWESSMAMPDLDKIIKLSKIFSVSTDFLLDDDLGMEQIIVDEKVEDTSKLVDLDLLNQYYGAYEKIARLISLATILVIISPIAYMTLDNINESLGVIIFLALIALAVGLFINSGFATSKFEFIEKEPYNFSYGVEGVIKKNLDEYQPILKRNIILAIAIFILSPAVYVLAINAGVTNNIPVYLFLILTAIGASLMGYSMIKYSSYRDILKYRDPKIQKKEGKIGKISGVLWITAIGVFFIYSFWTGNWQASWIIFVIASFLQVIIAMVLE